MRGATLTTILALSLLPPALAQEPITEFIRGDANMDGGVNISDPIAILRAIGGTVAPGLLQCPDAADADDNGGVNLTDAVYLLNFLFLGGPAPPHPFPAPGVETGLDDLACGDAG